MFKRFKRLWRAIKEFFSPSKPKPPVLIPDTPPIKPPYCNADFECDQNDLNPNSPYVPDKYEYNQELWDTMEYRYLGKQEYSHIVWTRKTSLKGENRYKAASELVLKKLGKRVPWQIIAVIHMKEGSGNFDKQILNGQKWWKRTTWVPSGHGPWNSWEEACVTAFKIKEIPPVWTIENTLYFLERFNGMGYAQYRSHIVGHTPYNWAFTNHYDGGYYVSDGPRGWRDKAIAMGVGCAVQLKELGFKGESNV